MFNRIISNYCYGAKFAPFVPLAWEVSNRVAKDFGIVKEPLSEFMQKEFQNNIPWQLDNLLPEQGMGRLAQRQILLFTSNQLTPLFEEFIYSTVIQYGLFTVVVPKILTCIRPSKPAECNPREYKLFQNPLTQKVCRIVASSLIFAMAHYGATFENEDAYKGHSMETLSDMNWMQVTGNMGAGLVYRTVYELAGQNLFAAWGTHAVYNYMYDLMAMDFWY